ncbi:helix-turn-helix transcriptional regulator [Paenibacillus chitinolyticus]|uniref:helix-turn-helix transcriptional regulator n=1 Tax=Paenibacillus chitinolyticus TaxID=79263 RepID=UPI0035E199BF
MVFEPEQCLIPELLHKIGKTQQWLADETGISRQRISDYSNLRHEMGISAAKTIAHAFGCSIDDLYTWRTLRD